MSSNRNLSNRSTSVSNRTTTDQELAKVLFVGRPPPSPQQLQVISSKTTESNDEQLYTKRQRHLLNTHTESAGLKKLLSSRPSNRLSTVLPPIASRKMPLKAFPLAALQSEGRA